MISILASYSCSDLYCILNLLKRKAISFLIITFKLSAEVDSIIQEMIDKAKTVLVRNRSLLQSLQVSCSFPIPDCSDNASFTSFMQVTSLYQLYIYFLILIFCFTFIFGSTLLSFLLDNLLVSMSLMLSWKVLRK